MRVPNKLGDLPTMKLSEEELARYAREADRRVVQAESAEERATSRPAAPSYPEIDVSVEVTDLSLELPPEDLFPPRAPVVLGADLEVPPESRPRDDYPSDVRIAVNADEREPAQGPVLTSIPCVVASKEDLSWFELEETSHVIL